MRFNKIGITKPASSFTIAFVVLLMFFMHTSVNAAWDGYVEETVTADVSLIDFNNMGKIIPTTGARSSAHTRGTSMYSICWDGRVSPDISISNVPRDWSDYEILEMWIYSEKATGGEFKILAETGVDQDNKLNYFMSTQHFDWEGWKKISIGLDDMVATRYPSWSSISALRLTVNG